jgi:hypothetical protein
MKLFETSVFKRIKYSMQDKFQHYGDILKKVERVIQSCRDVDQIAAAWRYADLFEEHCKRIDLDPQTRMIMRANVNNLLEDRWETLRIEKINSFNHEQ